MGRMHFDVGYPHMENALRNKKKAEVLVQFCLSEHGNLSLFTTNFAQMRNLTTPSPVSLTYCRVVYESTTSSSIVGI